MTGTQREELEALFRYCVRVPDDVGVAGVTRGGWRGWDSMAQVTLVGAIEDQFDLVLGLDEAQGVVDWASCVRVVAGKLGG
jgi:acyl carrier protein